MTTLVAGILMAVYSVGIAVVIVTPPIRSFRANPPLPDRWTRGFTRWWARCWRWAKRLGSRIEPAQISEPLITQAQIRQMRTAGRAAARVGDRPAPAEFAAAPPLDDKTVNRFLDDLLGPTGDLHN